MKTSIRTIKQTFYLSLFLLPFILAVTGCGSNGGGGGGGGTSGGSGKTISGVAVAGAIGGADVAVYVLNPDGTDGEVLGTGKTGTDGKYSITLNKAHSGHVRIAVKGGTYKSELDGKDVDNTSLSSILDDASNDAAGVGVTPLTDMVSELTIGRIKKGGTTLTDAHSEANALIAGFYGITGKIEEINPTFDKGSMGTDGFKLGFILGALDTCGNKISPILRSLYIDALGRDISDGIFDGMSAGIQVLISEGIPLPSTSGTTDFLGCLSSYANAPAGSALSDAGIGLGDLTNLVSNIKTAVSSSDATPKSAGLSAGSSGAISAMAFGGKQWLFIAARTQGVVAIDITDPDGSPSVGNGMIKVWNSLYDTTFNQSQVGGVIPLVGADHPQLMVYAYGSKHIALVNADTGAVEYEADLPLAALYPVSFSGGSAYIAGGIPDTGRDGVWLATADGYSFFDRASKKLNDPYPVESPQSLAENMGGDIEHGLLFAPNYAGYGGGVQLVDLIKNKSYYMDDDSYKTNFREKGLSYPDGGAVDSVYQVGIITNEDSPDAGFLNLKTIVKTDATSGVSTFVPGPKGIAHLKLGTYQPTISGSAVDSSTHMALFMAGYSDDIAVGLLQDPSAVPSDKEWTGLQDWRFHTLASYSIARDPHAVAVVNSLKNHKSYGYLLDGGNKKALQLDMNSILTMPALGTTGDEAHQPAEDPLAKGFIVTRSWE